VLKTLFIGILTCQFRHGIGLAREQEIAAVSRDNGLAAVVVI
jgi:hypothetical protein